MSEANSAPSLAGVIELRLTPYDQLYYVDRGGGDTFSTPPFIFHTALYYALGFLPSPFRTTTDSAHYLEDYEQSADAQSVYMFPATPVDPEYTTRRFICMGNRFRDEHTKENWNLKETGHQRCINPGTEFYTYMLVGEDHPQTPEELAESLPPYVRTGKKLTTTRLEARVHQNADIQTGEFSLGQPVAARDLNREHYHSFSNLTTKSWLPINTVMSCDLIGEYVTITPAFTREGVTKNQPVKLPTRVSFLGYHHQTAQ